MVVTGTHGKSTTTALIAWLLQHAGFDVGNIDAPLDAWGLLEQHSLVNHACIRVWSTIRTELLGAHR